MRRKAGGMDINRYKNQLAKLFQENNAASAYLFGSYAKNNPGPLSDIDIAVLLAKDIGEKDFFGKRLIFTNEIMKLFHQNKVDVIILNDAPPPLRFNVIKEGIIIFDANPKVRYMFESKTMIEYIDTKPLRDEYTSYLFKNIREGRFLNG